MFRRSRNSCASPGRYGANSFMVVLMRTPFALPGGRLGRFGQTWAGRTQLEHYVCHQRQKPLVICPASLCDMSTRELREPTMAGKRNTTPFATLRRQHQSRRVSETRSVGLCTTLAIAQLRKGA